MNNYKLYSKNRDTVRGGGVAIYVRNDVDSYEVNDDQLNELRSEQIWCKIKTAKDMILVGCVYRPPFADCELNIEINKTIGYASHLCSSKSLNSLVVAGDLNFPDILWHQAGGFCINKGRPSSLEFLETMNKNYLTQHVLEPTFKNNTLDLVITDDPARIFRVRQGPPIGSTEKDCLHNTLTWNYELRSNIGSKFASSSQPILSKGNYDNLMII